MPELPEVETVVRTLELLIPDRRIEHVEVRVPKMIQMDAGEFCRRLEGQHFRRFSRRGKYLIFQMDDVYFIAHMRMEGKFYVQRPEEPLSKHIHVIFDLDDGTQLRYHDTRKFGTMELMELNGDLRSFHELGPEPFDDEFNPGYCRAFLKKRRVPIKQVLLDQSFVAGIGNIYANEICFALRIDPRKRCGGPIKKIAVAQRGTYYCPHCQKKRGTGIEYDQNRDHRCDRQRKVDAEPVLTKSGVSGR